MSESNGQMRAKILGYADPKLALSPEPTPEWDPAGVPCVWVRCMTAAERDRFEIDFGDLERAQMVNLRARVLVRCLFQECGERIFEDGDAEALGKQSVTVINRLFERVTEINKIRAGDAEASLKNSPAGVAG